MTKKFWDLQGLDRAGKVESQAHLNYEGRHPLQSPLPQADLM